MKLWHIFQHVNLGYDTCSGAVVAAETAEEAVRTHPSGKSGSAAEYEGHWPETVGHYTAWAPPQDVVAELIGEAAPHITAGVILASFNAG